MNKTLAELIAEWRKGCQSEMETDPATYDRALEACADELEAALSQQPAVDEWQQVKPTAPGIYRVRGYELGNKRAEAVVSVALHRDELVCNLHECNSENDKGRWMAVEDYSDKFEWQVIALHQGAQP